MCFAQGTVTKRKVGMRCGQEVTCALVGKCHAILLTDTLNLEGEGALHDGTFLNPDVYRF